MNFAEAMSRYSPIVPTIPPLEIGMSGYSGGGMAASPAYDFAGQPAPSVTAQTLRNITGHTNGASGGSHVQSVRNIAPGLGKGPASPLSDLLGNIGTGVGIFENLAGIYMGWKAQQLARDNYKASLNFANQNMANTVKDHNARRADVLHARGIAQNDDPAKTQAAIADSMLDFKPVKG